ncbi:fibronectin type III domain-containing protein, partial [Candidatus Roizmanbacteria bacterium]|nr:fibronectin type III domain-containing protein [Candidatus Roizmanbacteria bacterium]
FSAIHNDPDGDPAVYYEIDVNTNSGFTGTVMWATGQQAMTSTANGVRSPDISYAGSSLSWGTQYFWRIRFTDNKGAVGAWSTTQNFIMNYSPEIPSLDLPTNSATNQAFQTVLKTTTTDNNSDYLRYKIELCTNLSMTQNCQIFDQTFSQTGWSGQNTQSSTAYTSGTQATYTIQSALYFSTTYYWRSYAKDPAGSNNWSLTQVTPYSFTTAPPSLAPTGLLTNGSTNPTGVLASTPPYFSAIHNDPSYPANYYEIQVNTQSDFGGIAFWDSGKSSMTTTFNGNRSPNISYTGTTLDLQGRTYYWRIRFWDTAGYAGAWSSTASFTMTQLGQSSSCTLQKNVLNTQITVSWGDQSTSEDGYYIERNTDSGGFANLTTRPANSTSYDDATVTSGHTYQYRIRAKIGSDYSQWCTTATLNLAVGDLIFEGILLK